MGCSIDEDLRELSSIKKNIDGAKSFAQYQDKLRGNTFDSALEQIIKMTPDEASLTLREADLALDSRQKASKKINEITDKLFKYWFIDYNFPDENNEPYQLNFGDMKETEYGFIPCNWTIVKMGDILAASTEKVGDREGVPEYSTTNQGVFPRAAKFNKSLTQNSNKNKLITKNDIVFGMSREIFNFGVMVDEIGSVSPAYHVYHIDTNVMNPEFLEIYMRLCSDYFLSLIKPGAREGQVENVKKYCHATQDFKEYVEMWIHEIKLPIASMTLILHNYKEKYPDVTERMTHHVNRVNNYLEQILYYVRSENAQKDYIISDCRLSKLIAAVAVKNKDDILENNIDFQVENADADVCTDSKWLEFILNQIISNSIKYRDEKKTDGT